MAAKLGHQSAGVLVVEAPVCQVLDTVVSPRTGIELLIQDRAAPVAIPMPQRADVIDVADCPALDQLIGLMIEGIVSSLMPYLKIFPCGASRLYHLLTFIHSVSHCL